MSVLHIHVNGQPVTMTKHIEIIVNGWTEEVIQVYDAAGYAAGIVGDRPGDRVKLWAHEHPAWRWPTQKTHGVSIELVWCDPDRPYGLPKQAVTQPAQTDLEERLRNVETWCARTSPRDVWGAFKRPEWLKDAAFLADAGKP